MGAPNSILFSETLLLPDLGSFNPANISLNYLADSGLSAPSGSIQSYSFNIPAGGSFSVILNEVDANAGVSNYSFNLTLLNPTAVP